MKHLRYFNESISSFNLGDMVYVDSYGPSTYGFSSGANQVKRNKPFKPKMYDFDSETKYEIIHIEKGQYFLYDNRNELIGLPETKLSKDNPFTTNNDYIIEEE